MAGWATAPSPEFTGANATATVRLWIDRSALDARVGLDPRWRAVVGPERLGAAVLEALGAAMLERLVAGSEVPDEPPATPAGAQPITAAEVEQLRRAWQDLREFRLQLAQLRATTWRVPGPGRLVTVVLQAVRIVGLELEPGWLRTAADAELEHHIGHTLRVALRRSAELPARALDGCPDLAAVLAGGRR